jgi:type VI secretion system protein ImpA
VRLSGVLSASVVEDLQAIAAQLELAAGSLKSIEEAMRSQGGPQAAPEFESLAMPLARTLKLVNEHLASRSPAESATPGDADALGVANGAVGVGAIRSRQDATRALDAVAAFFRANEPSSPVPLLIERAKRLVGQDFLEVLAELAPEALASAKAASGVRDSNGAA